MWQQDVIRRCEAGPKWLPPHQGAVKIIVDASPAKSEAKGGVATIARDCQGKFLGCSVPTVAGITDPTVRESMAC
jgi:hypothetical protein